MRDLKLFINNEWVEAENRATFTSYNIATGEPIAELAAASKADVDRACDVARSTFSSGVWSEMLPAERAKIMIKAAELLEERQEEFARLEAMDTGKPITETTIIDIPLSAWAFEYFANLAFEVQGHVIPIGRKSAREIFDFVSYEPYGVVAVISPFNFPLHLVTRSLCPALAAGNSVVCKASSLTPITTSLLGEIIKEAGFPPGVVNIVSGAGSLAGEALAINREIDVIAFTGSEEIGRRLIELSAKSERIKKTILELGGKGPAIVEPDCQLENTLEHILAGFCFNQGEVCCASTRLLLHESIYDDFLARLVEKAGQVKMGDILNPETQMGSLISREHLEKVDGYVKQAVADGARLLCGGKRYSEPGCDKGNYYAPTILDRINQDMQCCKEEIFGPVLVVMKYSRFDEAAAMANNTDFGLGANVFTENYKTAFRASKMLDAGSVWINMGGSSQMAAPFGGNKNSGLGREYGVAGLMEYFKVKNNLWYMGDKKYSFS
jgi:acyl-CoA reductase-like NAD-dependent aldehyde dehydrogenase